MGYGDQNKHAAFPQGSAEIEKWKVNLYIYIYIYDHISNYMKEKRHQI